jgi:hypothetical protein
MAIVGHFANLAVAQTLTQSKLLAGLIQETIEDGHLAGILPGMQISGLDVTYRRTGTPLAGAFFDIHEQIPWSAGNSPTSVTVALKRILRQDILDDFIALNYNSVNDYKAIMVSEMRFGVMRTAEDKFIYGNATSNAKEFDGLHALVPSGNIISMGGGTTGAALTLAKFRQLVDTVRPKPTFLLVNRDWSRQLDDVLETGIVGASNIVMGGHAQLSRDQLGEQQMRFRGIPIIKSDFVTKTETLAGGAFSSKTGSDTTSIFAVRTGAVEEGGLEMVLGSGSGTGPQLFSMREFEALEDYDGGGVRLRAYLALALGSTKALARIDGITDVPILR